MKKQLILASVFCIPTSLSQIMRQGMRPIGVLNHGLIQTGMDEILFKIGSLDITVFKLYVLLFIASLLLLLFIGSITAMLRKFGQNSLKYRCL